jgi:hypothetical protein
MKSSKKIIILSILLLFCVCSKEKNKVDPVNKQKFIKVYTELIKLSEHLPPQTPEYLDSATKIFNKYNFTKKEFQTHLSYYNQKPSRWEDFFQTVYDTLKQTNSNK